MCLMKGCHLGLDSNKGEYSRNRQIQTKKCISSVSAVVSPLFNPNWPWMFTFLHIKFSSLMSHKNSTPLASYPSELSLNVLFLWKIKSFVRQSSQLSQNFDFAVLCKVRGLFKKCVHFLLCHWTISIYLTKIRIIIKKKPSDVFARACWY